MCSFVNELMFVSGFVDRLKGKGAGTAKRAKKVSKDPNKPKRPASAFFVFMYNIFSTENFYRFILAAIQILILIICLCGWMIKWREEFRKQYKEEHPDNKSVSAVSHYYQYKSIKSLFLLLVIINNINLMFRLAKLVEKNGGVWQKLWVFTYLVQNSYNNNNNNNNNNCSIFYLFVWLTVFWQKKFLNIVWNFRRKLHMFRRQRNERVNSTKRWRRIIWNW